MQSAPRDASGLKVVFRLYVNVKVIFDLVVNSLEMGDFVVNAYASLWHSILWLLG
jgi:hypothetical protein